MSDLWTYRGDIQPHAEGHDGFHVDAADGHIGTIDEATHDVGDSYIVVDTGFWIFGTRRVVPASAIIEVDLANRRVTLSLTKDQIKSAPDFDAPPSERPADLIDDPDEQPAGIDRGMLSDYYGQFRAW